MNVGELEKLKKSLYQLLQSYREKIDSDKDFKGKHCSAVYTVKEFIYGYMGYMCPKCFDYTIRYLYYNSTFSIENEEPSTEEDVEMYADINIDITKRRCKACDADYTHMIPVDPNIVDCISVLNKKGYLTKFCCEGHGSKNTTGYIVFKTPLILKYIHLLPLTWNFDRQVYLDWNMIRIESDAYNYVESILDLREWVNNLPIIILDE